MMSTSGIRATTIASIVPPWPNGQGVGLLIRRLRVRVPPGVFGVGLVLLQTHGNLESWVSKTQLERGDRLERIVLIWKSRSLKKGLRGAERIRATEGSRRQFGHEGNEKTTPCSPEGTLAGIFFAIVQDSFSRAIPGR